jgi:hypothetical protein
VSGSRYDLFDAVARYRLGDEVQNITTPLLITDPEDERFFPGQPQELYTDCPVRRSLCALPPWREQAATASQWASGSATRPSSTGWTTTCDRPLHQGMTHEHRATSHPRRSSRKPQEVLWARKSRSRARSRATPTSAHAANIGTGTGR